MYKIRWKNYGPVDDTWECSNSLSCPDLLEAYNLKNEIKTPKSQQKNAKKRKSASGGNKASNSKKHRNSLDESEEEDDEPPYADGSSGEDEEYEVDKIVQMRLKKDGSREFFVHWKNWSKDYDTWEPEANLSCPDLIQKFMKEFNENKNTFAKELRMNRKHTQRFTLNTHEHGRRLSKRKSQSQRVTYYDEAASDED